MDLDYEIEVAALTHMLDGRQNLVQALIKQLDVAQLDKLCNALDALAYMVDGEVIRRVEKR